MSFIATAGLGNSLLDFGLSNFGANRAFNKEGDKAAEIFNWQLEADGKKYRRAVKDLKAAGLNPILAAGGGISGGSTPSVGVPSHGTPSPNLAANANSALASKKLQAELDLLKAQASTVRTQGTKNLADARRSGHLGDITQNFSNLATGLHVYLNLRKVILFLFLLVKALLLLVLVSMMMLLML